MKKGENVVLKFHLTQPPHHDN